MYLRFLFFSFLHNNATPTDHRMADVVPKGEEAAAGEATPRKNTSPESKAGCLEIVLFTWLNPLFSLAIKKRADHKSLDLEDLYEVVPEDSSTVIQEKFDRAFKAAYDAAKTEKVAADPKNKTTEKNGNSLDSKTLETVVKKALTAIGWSRFVRAGVLKIFNTLLQFLYPICVNGILLFIESGSTDGSTPVWVGYAWAIALGTAMFLKAMTENGYFHLQQRVSWQARTALQTAVYKKSLQLSAASRQTKSVGQIVNLMQLDSTRIEQFVSNLHMLWDGLFQITGYITILVYFMGPSALVGLLVMMISMPLQGKIMKKLFMLTRKMVKVTDSRVKMTNEAFQGVQCVKFYAWEEPLIRFIQTFRQQEIDELKSIAYVRAFSRAYMSAVPAVAAAAAFTVYALTGRPIKASILFTVLQGFGQLRFPLMFYPMTLAAAATAKVAMVRVADFLGMDNVQEYVVRKDPGSTGTSVKIEGGEFWWQAPGTRSEGGATPPKNEKAASAEKVQLEVSKKRDATAILSGVDMELKKGDLLGVVGPVGCGKSSLVNAILGEMMMTTGKVEVNGSVAYCGQTPWILNATVKDNILFGEPFDEQRYLEVLEACQLEADMRLLESGDMTMIGERGINLSGGQKQRVSLARAAYSGRDIYLLDDPLSALDPAVANKVFEACLLGLLKDRTRLLVTNQLQFLSRCNAVAVLKSDTVDEGAVAPGRISEIGTYDELMESEGAFSKLMKKSGEDGEHKTSEAHDAPEAPGKGRPSRGESLGTVLKGKEKGAKGLMQKEEKMSGAIGWNVYKTFVKAAGGWLSFSFVFLWYLLVVSGTFVNTAWVTFWTADAPDYKNQSFSFYVIGYIVCAFVVALLTFVRSVIVARFGLTASLGLHNTLLTRILKAPMSFFDTTPIGRIISRFSGDLNTIDTELIQFLDFVIWCALMLIATFSVIVYATPWFAAVIPFLLMAYSFILNYFRSVYLGAKRLDSISKSPVYAHFSETLGGLSTVRAYGLDEEFMKSNRTKVDVNVGAYYLTKACDRWLSVRLEILGAVVASAASILAVFSTTGDFPLTSAVAGLSIYYAASTSGILSWCVRQFAALENAMNSVERVNYYSTTVPQESTESPVTPSDSWPASGSIEIENLSMRYREGLPLVLKGLQASIKGGSRVGIVGRTGCGKSSLMLSLLRLVEPEVNKKGVGPIKIDGVNTSHVPLSQLRSRIGIIPQNPTLFSGTIRSNLDPFNSYEDSVIWSAIEKCGLKAVIKSMEDGLDSKVAEYGENLSQGQRQLLCLGRVLLKDCKILLLDEATSSVDFETDEMIQKTLREAFTETTILTIAHRVNTIMDSDMILVLDKGVVSENGSPNELLGREDGEFKRIVDASHSQ